MGLDMVYFRPTACQGSLETPQLFPDALHKLCTVQLHGPPAKILPVGIGWVCTDLDPVTLCPLDGFDHRVGIPGMSPTGNAAGTDKGKDVGIIAHPLPQVTVYVYFSMFHYLLVPTVRGQKDPRVNIILLTPKNKLKSTMASPKKF